MNVKEVTTRDLVEELREREGVEVRLSYTVASPDMCMGRERAAEPVKQLHLRAQSDQGGRGALHPVQGRPDQAGRDRDALL